MPPEEEPSGLMALLAWRVWLGRARPVGAVVGALLLVAAAVFVWRESATLADAWTSFRSAPPEVVAALLASMLAAVILTGTLFWQLTRRFGAVGFLEMQALMAATGAANYLPFRPGLLGRVVYHSARNRIRARDSLRTIVEAMLLSVVALALLVPALLVADRLGAAAWLGAAAAAAIAAAPLVVPRARPLGAAFLCRFAETLLTTLRYDLAFRLVGAPLPWHASAAVACVSMIATMVPFVSNGLGLREWAIGLLAPLLAGVSLERGLVAELLQRAAEVIVVVPAGLVGGWWLWRRREA